ncbi:cytidylate kinase family protein [Candidatus Woesearchaeota archaeon]|nr:cytidylate kinase family protein [Candidatus Woesearchaeota archaeon]
MKITISGTLGSGKSTVARILCKKLKLKYYYTGQKFRELAEESGMDIHEFGKLAEKSREIDNKLDEWQEELGKKEDNFLLDGHIAFHFVPDSIKIFLDGSIDERARRIFTDKSRKEKNLSLEDTKQKILKRESSERKRFQEYYGINHHDKSNYDIYVDTTELTVEEVIATILTQIKDLTKQ